MTRACLFHTARLGAFAAVQWTIYTIAIQPRVAPTVEPAGEPAIAAAPPGPAARTSYSTPHLSTPERLRLFLHEELEEIRMQSPDGYRELSSPLRQMEFLSDRLEPFRIGPNGYFAAIIDKDDWLTHAPGRRIIFAGGSQLAFGMDSILLERRYGRHVVNLGLQGNIDQRFILRHILENCREGDLVVMSFEYSRILRRFESIAEYRDQLGRVAPHLIPWLSNPYAGVAGGPSAPGLSWREQWIRWKHFADKRALGELAVSVRHALTPAAAPVVASNPTDRSKAPNRAGAEPDPAIEAGVFARACEVAAQIPATVIAVPLSRDSFNRCGDLIVHRYVPAERRLQDRPRNMLSAEQEHRHEFTANCADMQLFASALRARGADVVFACPPWPTEWASGPEAFVEIDRWLDAELELPVILHAVDSHLPMTFFYDSPNHLNWEGTKLRMATLIRALDRVVPPQPGPPLAEMIARREDEIAGELRLDRGFAGLVAAQTGNPPEPEVREAAANETDLR